MIFPRNAFSNLSCVHIFILQCTECVLFKQSCTDVSTEDVAAVFVKKSHLLFSKYVYIIWSNDTTFVFPFCNSENGVWHISYLLKLRKCFNCGMCQVVFKCVYKIKRNVKILNCSSSKSELNLSEQTVKLTDCWSQVRLTCKLWTALTRLSLRFSKI